MFQNFYTKEDSIFFIFSGIVGLAAKSISIVGDIFVTTSLFGIFEAIIQACLIGFLSGFLGFCGKKFGEWVWKKIK